MFFQKFKVVAHRNIEEGEDVYIILTQAYDGARDYRCFLTDDEEEPEFVGKIPFDNARQFEDSSDTIEEIEETI